MGSSWPCASGTGTWSRSNWLQSRLGSPAGRDSAPSASTPTPESVRSTRGYQRTPRSAANQSTTGTDDAISRTASTYSCQTCYTTAKPQPHCSKLLFWATRLTSTTSPSTPTTRSKPNHQSQLWSKFQRRPSVRWRSWGASGTHSPVWPGEQPSTGDKTDFR